MMECNRDEALRAREIAEKKLVSQDYHGALKFLQKALQLFPALENTSQMSAVIDVHIAAQAKINGMETDWYGILQVDPCAEDILIKKQYKKLALLLHPDKNKFAGAEAAFKLIGEALQVLSDKQQRSLHDSRRKPVGRGNSATQRSQSRQTSGYAYANRQAAASSTFITVCPSCHTRYQYYRVYENQNLLCHQCRIPFLAREFHTGQNNGAYNAYGWQHFTQQQQGFDHGSFQPFSAASNFTSGVKVQASHTVDPMHSGASKPGEPGGGPTAEHANQMFREKNSAEEAAQGIKRKRRGEKEAEKVMRRLEREQQKKAKADLRAQEAMERLMNKRKKQAEKASAKDKKRRLKKHLSDSSDDDEDESHSLDDLSDDQVLNHAFDSKAVPRRSSRPRRNVTYKVDVSDDDDDPSEVTQAQVTKEDDETLKETGKATDGKEKDAQNGDSADMKEKQKLADFFKIRIRLNLNLQGAKPSASVNDDSGNPGKAKRVKGEICEAGETSRQDHSVPEEESEGRKDSKEEPESGEDSKEEPESGEDSKEEEFDYETDDQVKEEQGKYSVPDPDFHDFDNDREEKDVAAGQIWAGYDDIEGLPRYYFRVKEVQSQTPFKVSICWLELRNMTEEQQTLKELGFSPTCGNCFRNSSTQVLDTVDMLSHILKWEKGAKGTIKIYPRKGDVWALYSDWEPGLGFKKRCLSRKYDMVEVLTDFSEQTGVSVTRLDKLPEYKTLFKCTEACLAIPAAELCRFSYQVPAYKLQGNEAPGIQKGCWELDPASVPIDLIFPGSNADKLR